MALTNFTELDFEPTKENLINFFKSQSEFTDFNFEGSGISTLMDLLTYTLTYMGVHGNMAMNEIFNDTAQLRQSVVSHAKGVDYFPRQHRAALATIRVAINNPAGLPAQINILRGTQWVCNVDNVSYNFTATDNYAIRDIGGNVYSADIPVSQGIIRETKYTYSSAQNQKFIIHDTGVDDSHIKVNVRNNIGSSVVTPWLYEGDITKIDNESKVYFLQETSDGKVEVYFGDGIVGEELENGNIVDISYLKTKSVGGNGCNVFTLTDDIDGYGKHLFTLTTVEQATGGSDPQSIESIRHTSPKHYARQRRLVTLTDYYTFIAEKYGWAESVNVWGGEDNIPAAYGKVFIAIKPNYGDFVSPNTKISMKEDFREENVVGIIPEIVDPNVVYVDMYPTVTVLNQKITISDGDLKAEITQALTDYFTDNVTEFKSTIRSSKIAPVIDAANIAIDSNLTISRLRKTFTPVASRSSYSLQLANTLTVGTVSIPYINTLSESVELKDDGMGRIDVYTDDILTQAGVGSVDYTTGSVSIVAHTFSIATNTPVSASAYPASFDTVGVRDTILALGNVDTSIIRI